MPWATSRTASKPTAPALLVIDSSKALHDFVSDRAHPSNAMLRPGGQRRELGRDDVARRRILV